MQHTLDDHVHLALRMKDGSVTTVGFLTRGTSPTLPHGARWEDGTGKSGIWVREATDENLFAEIEKMCTAVDQDGKRLLHPVGYTVVDSAAIPQDRTFRAALRFDEATGFSVDLEQAKLIHMARIREARNKKLDALDKDWMRATGQDDKVQAAAIEAERQVLRDIPQTIDLDQAQTADELKALWPDGLAKKE